MAQKIQGETCCQHLVDARVRVRWAPAHLPLGLSSLACDGVSLCRQATLFGGCAEFLLPPSPGRSRSQLSFCILRGVDFLDTVDEIHIEISDSDGVFHPIAELFGAGGSADAWTSVRHISRPPRRSPSPACAGVSAPPPI